MEEIAMSFSLNTNEALHIRANSISNTFVQKNKD